MYNLKKQQQDENKVFVDDNNNSYIPFPYDLNPIFEESRHTVDHIFDREYEISIKIKIKKGNNKTSESQKKQVRNFNLI